MDALQMQSPRDCPMSGPVYSISPNSGKTERGLAHGETGAGDKTRPVLQKYIKAATILQMENRAASLSQSVSWAPPGSLPTRREMASGQAAFLSWPCPS